MAVRYMSTIKIGPKGQIVIPKEAREMFGLTPGDTVLLLADKERGIAIMNYNDHRDFADAILGKNFSAEVTEGGE